MAYIELTDRTTDSITVHITGFDDSYAGTTRCLMLFAKKSSASDYIHLNSYTIPPEYNSYIEWYLRELEESTAYDLKVLITNISGTDDVALEQTIWTLDPVPKIDYFFCNQIRIDSESEFYAQCNFRVENASRHGSTEIQVYARKAGTDVWYVKSGNDIVETNTGGGTTIKKGYIIIRLYSDEGSQEYEFKLKAITNDEYDERLAESTVVFTKNRITSMWVSTNADDRWGDYTMYDSYVFFTLRQPYPDYATISIEVTDNAGALVSNTISEQPFVYIDEFIENRYDETNSAFFINVQYGLTKYEQPFTCTLLITEYDSSGHSIHDADAYSCVYYITDTQIAINAFGVEQNTRGGKDILCNIDVSGAFGGESVFEIWARATGDDWYLKKSGFVNSRSFSEVVYVNDYGVYEFELRVYSGEVYDTASAQIEVLAAEANKPLTWEWESSMNISLKVGENKVIYPVTADEWNRFMQRINDERLYLDNREYKFDGQQKCGVYLFTEVEPEQEFTIGIYQEAVDAIQGIAGGGWAGGLLSGADTAYLTASLFTLLAAELNAAIENL